MNYPFSFLFTTNVPEVAQEAELCGIDHIFVDLEILGKRERQSGRSTIISKHTLADVRTIRTAIRRARLLVRINPIHNETDREIQDVIDAGADILMLPMFRTPEEVEQFVGTVKGQRGTCLLLETAQAFVRFDEILSIPGIDMIHVGLNDLHISLGLNFMFESLAGGILDQVACRIPQHVLFGFGGGARIGEDHPISPEDVLKEHVRLRSHMIILSRTFHKDPGSLSDLRKLMNLECEIIKIRQTLDHAAQRSTKETELDRLRIHDSIRRFARKSRS